MASRFPHKNLVAALDRATYAGGAGSRRGAHRAWSTGVVRAFIGVWPSAAVVDDLVAMDRPEMSGLRWTTPDQWHVTLRFCGRLDDEDLPDLLAALTNGLAGRGPVTARLGPATERLGRRILCVPVVGLGPLVDRVRAATAPSGDAVGDPDEPFRGHLTLARAKRGVPADLVGVPVTATWEVGEVAVVSSTTASSGARYRTEARIPFVG